MARERAAFCSGSARGSRYASVTAVNARASCSANSSARERSRSAAAVISVTSCACSAYFSPVV